MSNIGDGIQVSELMDPLPQLSVLSFLPRASRDLRTNVSNSCNSNDLEFINDSMKLKDLKSPHKLLEQATAAIDGVSKLLDTNFSMLDTGENPNDTIREMRKGSVQDRRPGLGLKRPRFSMKPKSSQPVVLEPTLDIDKLEDPEEYFMAFEKRENARIELKRLRGFDLSDLDEHSPLRAEERRRPGLLGKTVHHYKHYSYGKDKKFVVSRETKEQEIMSSNHSSPEKAAPINESHEKGSIRESERRINKVLDELISDKCENLDMNGALSFLHEHLQIKPIDLDKLRLPDLPNVGKVDLNYNKENLVKPPKVSSVMENILKSIRDQTPKNDKPVLESPSSSIVSPTPPKNPFASTYLLKKSTVKSREKSHDMDVSDSDKPESTTILHHDNRNPAEIITCDSIDLSNKCSEMEDTDHVIRASNDTDILMIPNEMQDNVGDTPQEASAQCQHDTNVTKDISDKTPQKNKPVSGSPSSTIASPMLPKDPFASILLLKRSISKSTEKSHDAFTSLDPFSARKVSDAEHFDQRMIDSDNMESTMNEHVEITVVDRSPPQIIACDSVPLSNKCLEMEDTDHFRGAANDNVILITHNEIKEKVVDVPQEALTQCQHGTEITKDTPMRNTSDQTEGQTKVQENVEDQSHDVTLANIQFPASRTSNRSKTSGISKRSKVSRTSKRSKTQLGQSSSATLSPHTAGEPSKSPVKVSRQDNTVEDQSHGVILANIQFPASGTSKRSKTLLGQSSSAALSSHATGEPSVKVSGKKNKEPSLASQRNSKKPVNNGSKSKKLSRRQSLAEAGSSWTSGVRRSNRIKMRPLEFWKGERYLYGRVHESLTTVIGVKYMSPVKGDEKPTFKVKPFKDEYSELVEVAGLH